MLEFVQHNGNLEFNNEIDQNIQDIQKMLRIMESWEDNKCSFNYICFQLKCLEIC